MEQSQELREQSGGRFRAFVSYSHADQAAAARLHRRLEAYRLPRRLREAAAAGARGGQLGTIFRDREDLPAAEDLTASVKLALAQSDALVVLCSPAARASPWVAREIELFRELHPDRPILAALLHGTPEESFPEALRAGREPLAADLRREGDGPRLGFLKIIAGIAGVPLDALVQRDAQRRLRRVMAVTAGALAAVIVMAVMMVIALQARNEAQKQQAEAEGLVEYMLTDLREDLDGAAGLAVMTKVNKRALAYYQAQGNLDALSPDSLERRARAIGQLGEDAQNRNDFALARQNYDERYRITRRLLANDPANPRRKFDHALSVNRLALLAQAEGRNEESEKLLRQSWGLLEAVRAWASPEIEWQRAAALVSGNLCAIDALSRRVGGRTLDHCRLATALGRRLAQVDSEPSRTPYDLVFNLMWYGDALAASGNPAGAQQVRSEAMVLSARLVAANPGNLKLRSQQMELLAYLADTHGSQERRAMLQQAIALADDLIRRDPGRTTWISSRASYRRKLGEPE